MTGAPATVFEKKGMPFWVSITASGRMPLSDPKPRRPAAMAARARGYTLKRPPARLMVMPSRTSDAGAPGYDAVRSVTLITALGQLGSDLLEVTLASTALGMPGIAPAEQQNLAHVRYSLSWSVATPVRAILRDSPA